MTDASDLSQKQNAILNKIYHNVLFATRQYQSDPILLSNNKTDLAKKVVHTGCKVTR